MRTDNSFIIRAIRAVLVAGALVFALPGAILSAAAALPLETFDGVASPQLPPGWQSIVGVQADGLWTTTATTDHPADVSPRSGTNLAIFNSHDAGAGSTARLVSPAFSLAGVTGAKLGFWMYRDDADTKSDRIDVYVSTGTTTVGATLLGTIHRYRGWAPGTSSVGWQQFVFDLPAQYSGATNHVIFDGVTYGGGKDMYLDDIGVATLPGAPAINATVPGNGQVTIGFDPPASNGGSPITLYTATCVGGGTYTATGTYSPLVVTGLAAATSYTCTVSATNAVGTGPTSPGVVASTGSAPASTTPGSVQFTVFSHGFQMLTASGSPAPSIALAGTLPAGLSYQAATGLLSGTPAAGTVGTYPLVATASNGTLPDAVFPVSLVVRKASQTITFASTPQVTAGHEATLDVSSTSWLPVTVTSLSPSVCTVTDNWQLNALAAGTCMLAANQPGDADFSPAPQVQASFAISHGFAQAPTAASARPGNGFVTLDFSPPENNGGATITGYAATCQPGSVTVTGTASPLVVPSLSNGATVRCTIVAVNAAGPGDPTPVLLATPGGGTGPFALLADTGSGHVSAVDVTAGKVVATLAAGRWPLGVAYEPSGQRAWVADSGSNAIRSIDLATWAVSAPFVVGERPYGIAIDPSGAYAAVTLQSEHRVAFVDLASRTVLSKVDVGPSPAGVAIDGVGRRVLVANSGTNTVSVIDATTRTIAWTATVGAGPYGLALDPAGLMAYTANYSDGTVSSIDLAMRTVVTAPVGTDAYALSVDPTGRKVAVAGMSDGILSIHDATTLATIAVVYEFEMPSGVETSADTAYVVDGGAAALLRIDLATGAVTSRVELLEPSTMPAGFGKFLQRTVAPVAPPPPVRSLTVTRLGDGAGRVTSGESLIDCGSACSASANAGTTVVLAAAAADGSHFEGWGGACTGTGACIVTLDVAKTVTATFRLNSCIPRLGNIATRMQVRTGSDVMIGGFIVGGTQPKTVVVRARGPSLAAFGITGALADPLLQLFSGATVIGTNNDWGEASNAAALQATGYAPSHPREAALLVTLAPGAYTAIVSGVAGGTGVGIVEIFEVDHPETPLANISTRGQVLTGNDMMIGGFVIQGDRPQTVLVRARGPSLAEFGIAQPLSDPELQVYSGQNVIAANGDWQSSPDAAAIISRGFAPTDSRESVILITLPPGAYTAIVSGKNGATGVGLIEVFAQ